MAQFTVYTNFDTSAPVLNGTTGSLLSLLNACLVNGYGSKAAAGWTKPLPDTGSYGLFLQGAGSAGCYLFVNDTGPHGTALGKEARLTGWDSVTSILNGNVTGSNQWPTVAQLNIGTGAVIARKSYTADTTARNWILMADSKTCYFFALTGDVAGLYIAFMFGDIYSYKIGTPDTNRCMIAGRYVENSSANSYDRLDVIAQVGTSVPGHFISRTYSGLGGSITAGKHSDWAKSVGSTVLNGVVPYPNPPDGAIYISPVWVHENANSLTRGQMRGFWHICHSQESFTDGQIISGSGDLNGRTFRVIKYSGNGVVYCMETSDTVDTN